MNDQKRQWAAWAERRQREMDGQPMELEVSDLKVLHGAGGYYIGRQQFEGGIWWNYNRESMRYWQTREEAEKALESGTWSPRDYALENQR